MRFARVVIALLFPLLFANHASAAEPSAAAASYRVRYLGEDQFQVEAEFAQPTARLDLNSHEASGRPDSQAASIKSLTAFDAGGKPVPVSFVGHGTWEFKNGSASRIAYRVVADHDAAQWIAGKDEVASKFDRSYFFAGDAFFLVDYDWPKRPIEVDFQLPAGWRVTSPWPEHNGKHIAEHADGLGSNVFAMGMDSAQHVRAGQLEVTWLCDSRIRAIEPALLPLFDKLPGAYSEFWNGSPGEKLTVFFLSDPQTDGGAFRNSFALRLATPLRESERRVWEHTLAHELMHVWMNNSNDGIPTAGDGSAYWFTEGFTDYLTVKLMRQAGLLDESLAAQRLANQIRRYEIGKRLSPNIGLMAAGKEKHKHWELIYGGGAVLALLLDSELSRQSPTAFRDALRTLQHQPGRRMDGTTVLALLDQATQGKASALLQHLNSGLDLAAIREQLAPAGISVEGFASDEVYVGFGSCPALPCPAQGWSQH